LVLVSAFLLIIILMPIILTMIFGTGLARWQQVSIFTNPPRETTVLRHILDNYLSHFSLDFLFLKGDIGMPGQFITRHSVKGIGELYLFQLPLILTGLFYLFKRGPRRIFCLLLLWLVLYPLGSIFTIDQSAQATRSVIGVIPFQFLSAIGLAFLIELIHPFFFRTSFILLAIIIITFSLYDYLNRYFVQYPLYSADFWGWQYGPRETIKHFLSVKDLYDDLYMSGEFNGSEIFSRFYDPQDKCQNKCKMGDLWRQPEIYNPSRHQLFSLSPEYLSNSKFREQFLIKRTIYYPNGKIAFLIGEVSAGGR